MANRRLTQKMEDFCVAYVKTKSAKGAYRAAYNVNPNTSDAIAHRKAYEIMDKPHVQARIKELREQVADKVVWERADSINVLAGIARDEEEAAKASERVQAVKELNSMFGWNEKNVNVSNPDGSMAPTVIQLVAGGDE